MLCQRLPVEGATKQQEPTGEQVTWCKNLREHVELHVFETEKVFTAFYPFLRNGTLIDISQRDDLENVINECLCWLTSDPDLYKKVRTVSLYPSIRSYIHIMHALSL